MKNIRIFNFDSIVKLLIHVIFLQAILVILMLIFPEFKDFSFSILQDDRTSLSERYAGFRGLGYATSVTYDFSVIQSVGLLLLCAQITKIKSKKQILVSIVMFFSILVSVLVSGRTGWIGIIMAIFLLAIQLCSSKKALQNFLKLILISAIIIPIFSFGYMSFAPSSLKNSVSNDIIPFAFEMFINLKENGNLETDSSDVLKTMYFNIDLQTFLFGDGYYVDPSDSSKYYRETDAGIMREILYYGILGSLIFYFLYIYIFVTLMVKFKRRKLNTYFVLAFLMFVYYFLVQIKGDFLLGSNMGIKVLLLIYVGGLSLKYKNRQEV
ncbi:hypothetical protein POL88_21120 [Priestia megaterium]|uniref:hypothetical protein n=1 Tax=Priestia megaterium TaxID=1404 RepID=UPI00234F0C4B|nr:hypothetical protein [Priestia megaterium]MDC7771442.1 hypothetical protein [Priestia megaterium]